MVNKERYSASFKMANGEKRTGRLVRSNDKTVLVEIAHNPKKGGGVRTIKRHRKKHDVCIEGVIVEEASPESSDTPVDETGPELADERADDTTKSETAGS